MTKRILFLHAGGGKTGTSALQYYLMKNATKVESIGFDYVNYVNLEGEFEIDSGNGLILFEALQSIIDKADEIDNLVNSYFVQNHKAICSSELLCKLNRTGWERLLKSSKRLDIEIRVIFYIRDPISYIISFYDQCIKRHGEWRSFDEFALESQWEHFKEIQLIFDVFPIKNIFVRHFNSTNKYLIRDFFDVIGVDNSFTIDPNDQNKIINRSLTKTERLVMCEINSVHGNSFSTELSDFLIYSNPYSKVEPVSYKCETINYLELSCKNEVAWVNKTFFNGIDIVSVSHLRFN